MINELLENHLGHELTATVTGVKYNPSFQCAEVQLSIMIGNTEVVLYDKLSQYVPPSILAEKYKHYLKMFGHDYKKLPKNIKPGDLLINAWSVQWTRYIHEARVIPRKSVKGFPYVCLLGTSRRKRDKAIKLTKGEQFTK